MKVFFFIFYLLLFVWMFCAISSIFQCYLCNRVTVQYLSKICTAPDKSHDITMSTVEVVWPSSHLVAVARGGRDVGGYG